MREIADLYPKAFLARQGRSRADLEPRLNAVAESFLATLAALDAERLHESVAPGKWSPAQIAEHVGRANTLFARALEGALAGEPPLRMPRGRVSEDGRPLAPAEEEPEGGLSLERLALELRASVARLQEAARALEAAGSLEEACLEQSFFGAMSGLEVVQLAAWHTRHHEKQLGEKQLGETQPG